jgi:hypothetical protein
MFRVVTEQKRRRQILKTAAVAVVPLVAGCERATRHRTISLKRIRFEDQNGIIQVSGRVGVRSQGPDGWTTFHDVSVVAYDDEGEQVCATPLGDIEGGYRTVTFTLVCEHHPHRIVIEVAESPCDAETSIHKAVRKEDEDGIYYAIQGRGCETDSQ